MLTIENLKEFGANTEEGLARCVNNEGLYLKFVNKEAYDENFEKLGKAIEARDLKTGFETAHALKGVLGNLSLTPILDPIVTITEGMRNGTDMDYDTPYREVMAQLEKLRALL